MTFLSLLSLCHVHWKHTGYTNPWMWLNDVHDTFHLINHVELSLFLRRLFAIFRFCCENSAEESARVWWSAAKKTFFSNALKILFHSFTVIVAPALIDKALKRCTPACERPLTCHKVPAVMRDVHPIYGPWLGALQLSDGRTIVSVPVDDLQVEVKTHRHDKASEERRSDRLIPDSVLAKPSHWSQYWR